MARFILIDHSLSKIGGHHFDYALHVATAAEEAGFEVVLGTNRKFQPDSAIPDHWQVYPFFRYDAYSQHAAFQSVPYRWSELDCGAQAKPRWRTAYDSLKAGVTGVARHLGVGGPQRRVRQFAISCQRLFQSMPLADDDQVFLPTVSELDLSGLVDFLEAEPATRQVPWHLQFHFSLVSGREPDYERQASTLNTMGAHFQQLLDRVPGHQIHFYNTSAPLTRQYNRMRVAPFEDLTYPINQQFQPHDGPPSSPPRPLRITSAGALRREKGIDFLGRIMSQLWEPFFAQGLAEFRIQSNKDWFRLPLPAEASADQALPVRYVSHPLRMEQYLEFVCEADIGLLIYDPDRYYVRRAGVLGEFLAAGVPVIVPAGCWLAEQVAEANFAHVDNVKQLWDQQGAVQSVHFNWNEPSSTHTGALRIEEGSLTTCLPVPFGARQLMLMFDWLEPGEPGTYLRLECSPVTSHGQPRELEVQTVGRRGGEGASSTRQGVLVTLDPHIESVELRLSNAYQSTPIKLGNFTVHVAAADSPKQLIHPCGAVGLIAAEPDQYGRLLREMLTHHAHYRQTAVAHAESWRCRHAPLKTLNQLLTRAAVVSQRRAA